MIFDGHCHVGNWNFEPYKTYLNRTFEITVTKLENQGITHCLMTTSDQKKNKELLQKIKSYNGNLKLFFKPWIDPLEKNILNFLQENKEYIFALKFHPSLDKIKFEENIIRDFLDFAQKQNIPIMIHCGAWQEFSSYKFVLNVAKKYKKNNFILGHMGGTTIALKLEAFRAVKNTTLENIYFDTSGTNEYWVIEDCVKLNGSKRILYGSDYPCYSPKMFIENIKFMHITELEKKDILFNNMAEIIRKRRDFWKN